MPNAPMPPAGLPRPASPVFTPHLGGDQPHLPLFGLTILAVEDSRFACEALRLLCQRSGARLRRAENIADARKHLLVYRPDVAIIDLGLPDGRGEGLISDLAPANLRPIVILGTSGDPAGRLLAMAAGADGFLDKPLSRLGVFQSTILRHLPDHPSTAPTQTETPRLQPDILALHDDLYRASTLLAQGPDHAGQHYLKGFLAGVARDAADHALERAAGDADKIGGLDRLAQLLTDRLAKTNSAFADHPQGQCAAGVQ